MNSVFAINGEEFQEMASLRSKGEEFQEMASSQSKGEEFQEMILSRSTVKLSRRRFKFVER
ncbi:hypothetical protein A6V36_10700 [Paraburkholderia ginsengiterrae]|uniref:Uncharacterized protein n=1 Tax=Paraburkholderia ginsengiterrae TaxID=1462993 RepID=A0A1A9NCN8_9BURK|nr:hypothetical protein [Paraburkholderia ginsengiterrae]OAJ53918.1 hypothetical protein A6V36_10700 [Paraburkholderia ginsengiterrae]OAJ64742.1 hypothetical protein A6V37_18610 [Paraburkholderia ginsengiterrae]